MDKHDRQVLLACLESALNLARQGFALTGDALRVSEAVIAVSVNVGAPPATMTRVRASQARAVEAHARGRADVEALGLKVEELRLRLLPPNRVH